VLSKKAFLNFKSFLLLTLVFGGCFLMFGESLAENQGYDGTVALKPEKGWFDFVGNIVFEGVLGILYGLFRLVWMFFAMAMWLLDVVVSPEMFNQIFFSPAAINGINTAWGFVRDFFNLFFILIVVLIGLSVILGVSKFKDKSMLVKVALAAMLINFSKAITLFFIDMSQIFMRFFAEALGSELTAKFLDLVRFGDLVKDSTLSDNSVYLVTILCVIIMTIIMAVMIFYLAVSLIIRMVAFWVLIILSPLAFFGMAMEGTKLGALKDDWVKNLISWCFYGPILLFFIWLALILVATIGSAAQLGATSFSPESMDSGNGGLGKFVVKLCEILIPYITAIYLLFYGYDKAKSASTGAAASILKAGSARISQINSMAKKRGYGAGFILPKTRKGVQEGFKSRFENSPTLKRFTKKGKEDAQNKITAGWKDRITGEGTENWKGRVVGKGDAMREYNAEKAFEQVKKWKDNPPSNSDLNKAFTGEDEVKKIAATLYKSQNNKFEFRKEKDKNGNEVVVNEYQEAMEALKEHKNLQDKVTQEAKKENLGLVIDYQVENMIQNREKDEDGNLLSEDQARQRVFDQNLKGNLSQIFKKQNKDLYEQEGVIEYLDRKHADKDPATKRKFAENIKNNEIEEFIMNHSFEGVNLLGRS
jgi:hypothetical protein